MSSTSKLVRRSGALARRLGGARRSLVAVEFSRRLAITIAVALVALGGIMLTDWLLELSVDTRRFWFITSCVVVGLLALWTLIALFTQRRSDEEIALMVERQNPDFDSRLIGAVQFASGKAAVPEGASADMVQAMVADTESAARGKRFSSIVNPSKMARAALVLLAIAAVAMVGAILAKDRLPVLFARALGQDVEIPRATRIVEAPVTKKVGIGDTVELRFRAEGVLPESGSISVKYDSGRRESATMTASEEGRYAITLEDVPESFSFRARINDADTGELRITAIERPVVETVTATQRYPDFTKLKPTEHAPGDFALFPGSELELTITASKPLSKAAMQVIGSETALDLQVNASDPTTAHTTLTVPAKDLSGFGLSLIDTEEMASTDDPVYRVTLLADRAPEIRITYPKRAEELVTRKARLLVKFEATDRFGIATVALLYRKDQEAPIRMPIEIPSDSPTTLNEKLDWNLATLQPGLIEGDVAEYWLEATDQNGNVGSSAHLMIEVVTPDAKRADLLGRASDALGGVSEATSDQERLNNDLKTIIEENNR